ncbi:patatin-like phospholipase family protein [Pseudovibrio sp. POLY-S9]|uniref:patatin-like phospholipase family protein n=1 Tax=Pseudovibrio sp. POLY-S9 TaxID=1576596 RepID=UPI00070B5429|nr:patatin-like phospholipase family protein [Pseudovibrio sp. POLY-S9]
MKQFIIVIEDGFAASVNGIGIVFLGKVISGEAAVTDRVDFYDALPFEAAADAKPDLIFQSMITRLAKDRQEVDRAQEGDTIEITIRAIDKGIIRKGCQIVSNGQAPLRGSLLEPPRPAPISRLAFHWRPDPRRTFGIGLQGGGLKGAFGVGAMRFLAELDLEKSKHLKVIGSASTGSITSRILMLDRGMPGVDDAVREYTDLQNVNDMLKLRPEVRKASRESHIAGRVINAALTGEVGTLDPKKMVMDELVTTGSMLPALWGGFGAASGLAILAVVTSLGPIGIIGGLIIGAIAGGVLGAGAGVRQELEQDLEVLEKLMNLTGSIAVLDPVETRLKALAGDHDTRRAGIKWRISVNCLETGVTAYITEQGRLLYPDRDGVHDMYHPREFLDCKIVSIDVSDNVNDSFPDLMIKAALTSGSFPGVFEPRLITFSHDKFGGTRSLWFNDGGIRENLPLQSMVDAGADQIVAIYCAPIEPAPTPFDDDLSTPTSGKPMPKWTDVAGRAVALTFAEITRTDVAFGRRLNAGQSHLNDPIGVGRATGVDVIDIAPRVPTLGLTEVNPRKIEATIVYGYMCAYDELWIANRKTTATERSKLRENTDQIYKNLVLAADYSIMTLTSAVYRNPDASGKMWNTLPGWNEDGSARRIHRINFQRHALRVYSKAKHEFLRALVRRHAQFGDLSLPLHTKNAPKCFNRSYFTDWSVLQYGALTTMVVFQKFGGSIGSALQNQPFLERQHVRTDNHQKHDPEVDTMASWEHRKDLKDQLEDVEFLR